MEPGASRNARLSPRQLQIVKIIVEDLCSKQIAAGLGISTKTVTALRVEIRRRLGVKGTAGIVRWASRNGVIEA